MLGFYSIAASPIAAGYVAADQSDSQPIVLAVVVIPGAATVAGSGTQQFSATVPGLNSSSQLITWTASAGAINASGLFTAPAATPGHQYIFVTATSVADPSKSQTVIVTIPGTNPPVQSGIFQSRRRGARRVQRFS